MGSAITSTQGIATLKYNSNQIKGKYIIEASFAGDNTYYRINGTGFLTVNTIQTKLTVSNITTVKGTVSKLTSKLTNIKNKAVANKKIIFKVNGTVVGLAITNTQGIAILNYQSKSKGKYNILVIFNGDNTYEKNIGTSFLKVT